MCIKTLIKWFEGGHDPGNRSAGRPGGGRPLSPATALGRDRWPEPAADSRGEVDAPLKPCPFCGVMPTLRRSTFLGRWLISWAVRCPRCKTIAGPYFLDTKQEAVAVWNMRATGPSPVGQGPKLPPARKGLRRGEA